MNVDDRDYLIDSMVRKVVARYPEIVAENGHPDHHSLGDAGEYLTRAILETLVKEMQKGSLTAE